MGGEQEPPPPAASPRPRVVLLCSPCMGHLIPFAELARRLVADLGLAATLLFASATAAPSEQYLALAAAVPDGVDLVALPAPPEEAQLPPSAAVRDRAEHAAVSSVPRVREIARALAAAAPLVALVVDMVCVPVRGVADELGVPCYMFFTSPWMLLSLLLHLPELDAARTRERWDETEPILLPGCVPIHAADMPRSMRADRSSGTYSGFLAMAKGAALVDGILVNTFPDLEPAVVGAGAGVKLSPAIHAVGPLVWSRPVEGEPDHECIRWLDQQPRGSVVYVSFGSGGTLTSRQTAELALGLELSRHRFMWVAKPPDEHTESGAFFGTRQGGAAAAPDFLPDGFAARTSAVGLVIRHGWVPQTAILGHAAVGCFVTHCGWNSALESAVHGVPMVAWPLYAEQKMNAAMLEAQAGVAARVEVGDDRVVRKEEVARVIRRVMEGEQGREMRSRVRQLQCKAAHAMSAGGASARALARAMRVSDMP